MTRAHEPMPPAFVQRVADQFRALAEPLRLRLMNALFAGDATVGELAEATGASIANVSKHLGVLHQAGWVTRTKEGTSVRYAMADQRTVQLCELMCTRVRERAASEAELAALAPRPSAAVKSSAAAGRAKRGG